MGNRFQLVYHDSRYVDGVGDVFSGIGNRAFEMVCSNNQIQWHTVTMRPTVQGSVNGVVPGACYGKYWYFFRFERKGPVNNDPGTRWFYSGLFEVDENNPGDRIDPESRSGVQAPGRTRTANWFRFRHPHAHDGNNEAIFDSQNNSSKLAGLARFESSVSESGNNVQINPGLGIIRIEALETGAIQNFVPVYAYNTGTCCGDAFNYGNVVSYELTAIAGGIDSQTYNTLQNYVVGQGFNSPLGDPRLTLAGAASTHMVFSDAGSHIDLEKNAVFTQHLTTLTNASDVDTFLDGHAIFHGVSRDSPQPSQLDSIKIGTRTCGNCHFRDGRGDEVIQTSKGPRIPPPVFGVGLLQYIDGAEAGLTWDGSVSTVEQQVSNALISDHGVSPSSLGGDLRILEDYTRFLTVPNRQSVSYELDGVEEGHVLFYEAGCADCHQENQRTSSSAPEEFRDLVISPFTDMKVHSINGGSFRTAPLWGLGTNIRLLERNGKGLRLMHDGGATSLRQAISQHGSATSGFNQLSNADQQKIINFLRTL